VESVSASSQSETQEHRQRRCVHTITDRFSMANTYLIIDKRLIVVDPGSDRNVRLLQTYLQRFLHRSLDEIDLIVLTHLHTDHSAGVTALRHLCSAPLAASSVARTLTMGQDHEGLTSGLLPDKRLPGILQHVDLFLPAYERYIRQIDLWLDDVAGLPDHPDWRVIASPGHTPDSLCLYNPFTRELLCGDTVTTVQGGAPLVRGSTNRRQLVDTLSVLRSLDVSYLYPGHGRPIPGQRPLSNMDVEW
jgi:hydroxyacylglutathione hydrolase